MKRNRSVVKIFVLLMFAAALISTRSITVAAAEKDAATKDAATKDGAAAKDAAATPAAAPAKAAANPHAAHMMDMAPAQTAPAQSTTTPLIRRGMKMHVQKWATLPTGSANTAVTPLDPNTIPKFVNQLTRPATFVPAGTKFDPQLGRNVPRYDVTEVTTTQQILPPGFPRTKIYAYSGQANVAAPGQPQNIQTVASTPGPTFETTSNQRIFVHYKNELEGPHMFPVDPTIMAANPNNAPIPQPPFVNPATGTLFVPFPPGYPQFQEPIVTVAHLHGGVT